MDIYTYNIKVQSVHNLSCNFINIIYSHVVMKLNHSLFNISLTRTSFQALTNEVSKHVMINQNNLSAQLAAHLNQQSSMHLICNNSSLHVE